MKSLLLKEKEKEYFEESLEQKNLDISPFAFILGGSEDDEITKKVAKKLGYTVETVNESYYEIENDSIEIEVETTVFENFGVGETHSPSKEICQKFGLFLAPQTSELHDNNGNLVSTAFKHGEGYNNTSTFAYIRKDYLERYIKEKNLKLVWIQWVEKSEVNDYQTHYKIIT